MTEKLKYSANRYFIAVLIVLACGLRLYGIDSRPVHHDESLHIHYSYAQQQNFSNNYYKYNPMLHGPLLYDITSIAINFFGNNKKVWRLPSLIFGLGVITLYLLLFRRAKSHHLLIFGTLVTLSPTLIYWSRFLRNDIIVVFFHLLILYIILSKAHRLKALITLPLVTLLFCLKENSYLTLTQILLISLPYLFIYRPTLPLKYWKEVLLSLLFSIFIYTMLYSAFFHYPEGILDGLYRKSLLYWFNQHSTSRIDGPFSFQILNILIYSPLFFISVCLTLTHFMIRQSRSIKYLAILIIILSLLLYFLQWPKLNFLKFAIDYTLLFLILAMQLIPILFLKQKKITLYFTCSFFLSSLLLYSYVGEKVPWLSIYPYTAGVVFLFFYWKDHLISTATTFVLISIIILVSTLLNNSINYSYSPNEFIHQVGSTHELEKVVSAIKPGEKILIKGEIIWPLHIFFEQNPNYQFHSNRHTNYKNFDVILIDKKNIKPLRSTLMKDFIIKPVPFRRYWWPRRRDYNFASITTYLFTRKPPTPLTTDIFYYLHSK